ncbi:uncharacterized protein LOC142587251 [Dermacentor variabilis]|uniref:uncharacterized protein LOC142587251 n=1 Tax=Dermacentor variabilis TaxID=34621 RepID=UPI003F5B65CF
MVNVRFCLIALTAAMLALPCVTKWINGRQRGPGWVRVPAAHFGELMKLAQLAAYRASPEKYLYHVVVINEARSRPEGRRWHIQMKLKVAESVCLTKHGRRPTRPCPQRPKAPVRRCEMDIIRGLWRMFVHVHIDCERPHH